MVALAPGSVVTGNELQEHAASRLARFKIPTQVHFMDGELPRTATGKVLKRELRDQLGQ